jgi:hypothetical protein
MQLPLLQYSFQNRHQLHLLTSDNQTGSAFPAAALLEVPDFPFLELPLYTTPSDFNLPRVSFIKIESSSTATEQDENSDATTLSTYFNRLHVSAIVRHILTRLFNSR